MGRWICHTSELRPIWSCTVFVTWVAAVPLALPPQTAAASPPPPAPANGYQLTFVDDFRDPDSIALDATSNRDAKWFRNRFFGEGATPRSMLSIRNGVLTLRGTTQRAAHIQTASPSGDDEDGWAGRVFRNGAYIEARIAVGSDRLATESAWPSFWSMAIEHMPLRGRAQWQGQPIGYMRFIENDFFEYNPQWSRAAYYATLWEWYDHWERCGKGRWCDQSTMNDPKRMIPLPKGRRFSSFNVYGQKWVPAHGRQRGYVQNYLNGQPVGPKVSWRTGEATPPSSGDLRFNVIDRQGLMLVLATGGQPMHVDWVKVWQTKEGELEHRR
jgi:hypothetical protein